MKEGPTTITTCDNYNHLRTKRAELHGGGIVMGGSRIYSCEKASKKIRTEHGRVGLTETPSWCPFLAE